MQLTLCILLTLICVFNRFHVLGSNSELPEGQRGSKRKLEQEHSEVVKSRKVWEKSSEQEGGCCSSELGERRLGDKLPDPGFPHVVAGDTSEITLEISPSVGPMIQSHR